MPSSDSLIRNLEYQLQTCRQKNLRHLNDQYGHGFQNLLIQLVKHVDKFTSSSAVSNLVNASKHPDGSMKTVFDSYHARLFEEALDLPMSCLDVPDWHFENNLEYFWQYAARASDDRKWFDELLRRLLDVSPKALPSSNANVKSKSMVDWEAIRVRLKHKYSLSTLGPDRDLSP